MMRAALLYLSTSAAMCRLAINSPVARRAARRFVAGDTSTDVLNVARNLLTKNIYTTMDLLGESVFDEVTANAATDCYIGLLDEIGGVSEPHDGRPHVSIKLTQLGLDVGLSICEANVGRILDRARQVGSFVRIDMESSAHTQRTLDLYRNMRAEFGPVVGVVIQAYLYRSEDDVRALINEGMAHIRLCKGAYKEPPDRAFPKKAQVDANMARLMEMLLDREARDKGAYLAMGTHDEKLIEATKRYAQEHSVPRDDFEFQMLYGIRRDLQEQLAGEGYRMRVYVPYGTEWYPYFMRRLAERPANVWFILSNLFKD
jgi:proline dehydrogenase